MLFDCAVSDGSPTGNDDEKFLMGFLDDSKGNTLIHISGQFLRVFNFGAS